jgi:site-specific DNA-cytosine methylase
VTRPVRVVSAFCGAGFADYALRRASERTGIPVEIVLAFDLWPKAVNVYNANLSPRAVVADANNAKRADLPPHDLVIGGPPCQPFSSAGTRLGHADPRNCIPAFMRLAGDGPYVMENVRGGLVSAPFVHRLRASDFGDVTDRRRWYYTPLELDIVQTPGPRRIRDIREHDADEPWRRGSQLPLLVMPEIVVRAGSDGNGARILHDGDFMPSLTGKSWNNVHGTAKKKIALRGHGHRPVPREDDAFLGSLVGNAFRVNGQDELAQHGGRNVTLLEMQRAHSVPDSWRWPGCSKDQRGLMIANAWPIGMGTAILAAALRAVVASRAGDCEAVA